MNTIKDKYCYMKPAEKSSKTV